MASIPPSNESDESFVQLLTGEQMRLLYYITALLGDPHAAENVLQETNIVLWRKSSEFVAGTNFRAWSRKVAYWQVQAYVRDAGRDRHVFSEQMVEQLAQRNFDESVTADARVALRDCLKKLSRSQHQLLRHRYEEELPMAAIAKLLGKTETAVRAALMRARRGLQRCIGSRLEQLPS